MSIIGEKLTISKRLFRSLRNGAQNFLGYVFPALEYRKRTRRWDSSWSKEDYSPIWMTEAIPRQIREAVDSGWFQPGAIVLDIGCGNGDHAAWLAGQGFQAMGIDLARSAIDKAEAKYHEMRGKLAFKTVDICRESPTPARFQALIDRGCFHGIRNFERRTRYGIQRTLSKNYVKNVAACCVPRARFLLLIGTFNHPETAEMATDEEEIVQDVRALFQADFEIAKLEKITMEMASSVDPMPAISFWMIRR